jgi:hypothetical protein|tara:strand:+ start:130 stop:336 length:207 start_codon:yes stop_codon:yes gene_type:complete
MILKLNNEEEQVLRFMFKEHRLNSLPPAIKDVALEIKRVVDNPDKANIKEYDVQALNPAWKNCENCDE